MEDYIVKAGDKSACLYLRQPNVVRTKDKFSTKNKKKPIPTKEQALKSSSSGLSSPELI